MNDANRAPVQAGVDDPSVAGVEASGDERTVDVTAVSPVGRHGLFARLKQHPLARLGPGLITGVADDDPSGIATYSQAGAQFGLAMLWTMPLAYRRAARRIEASNTDIVWVQHEYGIFGGPAGAYLLDLIDAVSMPVVATLHTVLEGPDADQRHVLEHLAQRASLLIVMAHRARRLLEQIYNVPRSKIAVIEHGVPERGYVAPSAARQCFGIEDRKTVMTFGLLSPDKGIETMIRAMPQIIEHCPEVIYRIVGATHPHLLAHEGERHREMLQALADKLGVASHLRWDNRFLDEEALLERLATADVYVTPYRNPQQITSGTLSYAAALGKPIVATPYVHATELLADQRGILVGFDDIDATAQAVGALLSDDDQRKRLAARTFAHSRALTWSRMARRALDRFQALDAGIAFGAQRPQFEEAVKAFA